MQESVKAIMKQKTIAVEKMLKQAVGSSGYMLTINGIIRKHASNAVYVRADGNGVSFYIRARVGDRSVRSPLSDTVKEAILLECSSSELFGRSFLDWTSARYESTNQWLFNVGVNPTLSILYFETDMYYRFRKDVLTQKTLNVATFVPTEDGGVSLSLGSFLELVGKVRMNAFKAVMDLCKYKYIRALSRQTRLIYRFGDVYFPAMIRDPNLFNPFFDDELIAGTLRDRLIYKLFVDNSHKTSHTGLITSYLTHLQVSKALGLTKLVPFNFDILFKLLVGMVLDPRVIGTEFPNRNVPIFRITSANEFYDAPYLTVEQYRNAGTDERSYYTQSTTFNYHIVENMPFFRKNGYGSMTDLLDVMGETTLV
jgi:hypothetical protein